MTYTDDQECALTNMLIWSKQPIKTNLDYLYTLDGAAGTGKTTIVKAFLQRIDIKSHKIAVTAPTHKAKKVIQAATNYSSKTIQKLLGLRPDVQMDKFDVNNPTFNPIAEDEMCYYKVVIIDESSMLSKDAFKLITEKAYQYKVRVLFLGDAYQLPPIGEKISKVFSDVINKSTLTTVVRQSQDNPMTVILKMLRTDIQLGTDNGIKKLIKVSEDILGEKGFKCLPQKTEEGFDTTFGVEMLEYYFNSEYKYNKDYIKFISYTNKSVVDWSESLRNRLLGEDANNIINIGEILTGYNSIIESRSNSLIIENSEDYIIKDITAGNSEAGIKGFYVVLENSKGTIRTVFIVDHTDLTTFREIALPKLRLAQARRGYNWKKYFDFKNEHLLLTSVLIDPTKPTETYGNLLAKKDLYYGYGCTVHKSQGSTYDNVAINLKNLYKNFNESERARLIYVALSRTKNMNLILIK